MGSGEVRGTDPAGARAPLGSAGFAVELGPATPEQETLGARCDAIVLSAEEREACAGLIAGGLGAGAMVAVTAGAAGGRLMLPDGARAADRWPRVSDPSDDLGAGDVFAAALFVELHRGGCRRDRAAAFAAAAAAVRLDGKGPGAIGDRAAIERRLAGSER